MPYDSKIHHRRSIRLRHHDYIAGVYFFTLVAYQRECLFGSVVDEVMQLNDWGRIVAEEWARTPAVRANIELDSFVIMPNHVHGIVWINCGGDRQEVVPDQMGAPDVFAAEPGPRKHSLGAFIGGFKAGVTKRINTLRGMPGGPVWQRNYYEHVIRNETELARAREYIETNPLRWVIDKENPNS